MTHELKKSGSQTPLLQTPPVALSTLSTASSTVDSSSGGSSPTRRASSPTGLTPRMPVAKRDPQQSFTNGDIQLAAYVLARQVHNRPVPADELNLLQYANEAVQAAQRQLDHGNVTTDIHATNHLSTRLVEGVRAVFDKLPQQPPQDEKAGVFASVGAGNCWHFSRVGGNLLNNLRIADGGLLPGEKIEFMSHALKDHAYLIWSVTLQGPEILLDPWSTSSAINVVDAQYVSSHQQEQKLGPPHITQASSGAAQEAFNKGLTQTGPELQKRIDAEVQQLTTEGFEYARAATWEPEAAIYTTFCQETRTSLNQISLALTPAEIQKIAQKPDGSVETSPQAIRAAVEKHAQQLKKQRNEDAATQVALAMGASLPVATQAAPDIVQAAQNLDNHAPKKEL
jgi:hypothetical protein